MARLSSAMVPGRGFLRSGVRGSCWRCSGGVEPSGVSGEGHVEAISWKIF